MTNHRLTMALVCVLPLTLSLASCREGAVPTNETASLTTIGVTPQNADPVENISPPQNTNQAECVDTAPLGDGWGWDGTRSCELDRGSLGAQLTPDARASDNCSSLDSGEFHITELVTDVVLTAGQSNATGGNTLLEPERFTEDTVNTRVLAWTANQQWEIANPQTQTWHDGRYPSGRGRIQNHPAFQIGRAIAQKGDCRVVAIISTAATGMEIDHWREDRDGHFTYISDKVTAAINALPTKHSVDMIWWMQGEADNDQFLDRYFGKLNQLIAMFRGETWFDNDGYFLANETGWFPYANEAIRMLGTDGNRFTDYSRGESNPSDPFPSIEADEFAVHFNETSLRKIGDLVADKYLYEYLQE